MVIVRTALVSRLTYVFFTLKVQKMFLSGVYIFAASGSSVQDSEGGRVNEVSSITDKCYKVSSCWSGGGGGGGGEILKFRGYTCGRYQTPGNSKIQDNSVWVS